MGEVRFYHLERRRIDQALPDLIGEALAAGWRVVIQTGSEERSEALNERLWAYSDDSFLPHGSARDGDAASQPVYLTAGEENPNGARLRVLLTGAPVAACLGADYDRIVLLFEGRDAEALAEARRDWAAVKAAGAAPGYWREGEEGKWENAR